MRTAPLGAVLLPWFAPLSTQPEFGDIGGLLRVANNPWSGPATQQMASGLLQNQMPQRPNIIEGPVDPDTSYPTKLVWSPTRGVLGRLNADGSIAPAGAVAGGQTNSTGSGTLDDGVRMLTNRIPVSDRLKAGFNTATGLGLPGADYATNLQNERWKDAALAAQHPILSKGLGVTGGGAAAISTLPEGALAGGSTMLARAVAGSGAGDLAYC